MSEGATIPPEVAEKIKKYDALGEVIKVLEPFKMDERVEIMDLARKEMCAKPNANQQR